MPRISLALVAAPIGLALVLATSALSQSSGGSSLAGGPTKFEPVLVYDVVGGTLTGPVHTHLTVYNNGFATIARFNESVIGTGGPDKDVATAALTPAEVQQLQSDLRTSGAFALQDQGLIGADVPLSTLTVFRGGTDSLAHTYSYIFGSGGYAGPQAVISDLVDQHFPGF